MKKIIILLIICVVLSGCKSKPIIEAEKQIEVPVEVLIEVPIEKPVVFEQKIIEMVQIQGGVLHNTTPVRVEPFYLGIYLVTQEEFYDVMRTTPSFFKGDLLPVENISWIDAIEFCNRLSKREGLTPAYTIEDNAVIWNREANGYRLPTGAEWEYACRAGTTTPFNTGNNITSNQANFDGRFPYSGNTRMEYRRQTTPVGTFAANRWGLFDMHGNVWEWCWDRPNGNRTDISTIQLNNSICVIRGGAWSSSGVSLHSSYTSGFQPHIKNNYVGFRVARDL